MTWDSLVGSGLAQAGAVLAEHTTYKLGGPAAYWVVVQRLADLGRVAEAYGEEPLPVLIVGRGSNLVIADRGFGGVVLHLSGELARIDTNPPVRAGGGAGLPQVARAAVKAGRLGLEFMVGIPGTVGGAVRQNAGCFGREIVDVLVEAEVFDLETGTISIRPPASLDLRDRHSAVTSTEVVVAAKFTTSDGEPATGEASMLEITRWRRAHQPGGTLNAGSVFKNPPGDSAGRIIDATGLKGMSVGGASVSDKHANFFVAKPGTKAVDVYRLVREVATRVREATGIVLVPEIQFAGNFEEEELG
ncbi:MAG TPA: UDP-N-acetylmuramate dehydrogenase [Acidimicrobiia bacterium]|nr:UDP-N-acetylmuramate dehydrogenase [Acidimicrobiia bacterium]